MEILAFVLLVLEQLLVQFDHFLVLELDFVLQADYLLRFDEIVVFLVVPVVFVAALEMIQLNQNY